MTKKQKNISIIAVASVILSLVIIGINKSNLLNKKIVVIDLKPTFKTCTLKSGEVIETTYNCDKHEEIEKEQELKEDEQIEVIAYNPSSNQTTNYSNMYFNLQYPDNFEINTNEDEDFNYNEFFNLVIDPNFNNLNFKINADSILHYRHITSTDELIYREQTIGYNVDFKIIEIDGHKALLSHKDNVNTAELVVDDIFYTISNDNKGFNAEQQKINTALFDQIISTIKVTPTVSDEVKKIVRKSWQYEESIPKLDGDKFTVSNEKYSIQYPSNWFEWYDGGDSPIIVELHTHNIKDSFNKELELPNQASMSIWKPYYPINIPEIKEENVFYKTQKNGYQVYRNNDHDLIGNNTYYIIDPNQETVISFRTNYHDDDDELLQVSEELYGQDILDIIDSVVYFK